MGISLTYPWRWVSSCRGSGFDQAPLNNEATVASTLALLLSKFGIPALPEEARKPVPGGDDPACLIVD